MPSSPMRRRMSIIFSLCPRWWNDLRGHIIPPSSVERSENRGSRADTKDLRVMCRACEQDAIWLAYLDSQGMLKPDDPEAVEKFFADFPVQPVPGQSLSARPEWD